MKKVFFFIFLCVVFSLLFFQPGFAGNKKGSAQNKSREIGQIEQIVQKFVDYKRKKYNEGTLKLIQLLLEKKCPVPPSAPSTEKLIQPYSIKIECAQEKKKKIPAGEKPEMPFVNKLKGCRPDEVVKDDIIFSRPGKDEKVGTYTKQCRVYCNAQYVTLGRVFFYDDKTHELYYTPHYYSRFRSFTMAADEITAFFTGLPQKLIMRINGSTVAKKKRVVLECWNYYNEARSDCPYLWPNEDEAVNSGDITDYIGSEYLKLSAKGPIAIQRNRIHTTGSEGTAILYAIRKGYSEENKCNTPQQCYMKAKCKRTQVRQKIVSINIVKAVDWALTDAEYYTPDKKFSKKITRYLLTKSQWQSRGSWLGLHIWVKYKDEDGEEEWKELGTIKHLRNILNIKVIEDNMSYFAGTIPDPSRPVYGKAVIKTPFASQLPPLTVEVFGIVPRGIRSKNMVIMTDSYGDHHRRIYLKNNEKVDVEYVFEAPPQLKQVPPDLSVSWKTNTTSWEVKAFVGRNIPANILNISPAQGKFVKNGNLLISKASLSLQNINMANIIKLIKAAYGNYIHEMVYLHSTFHDYVKHSSVSGIEATVSLKRTGEGVYDYLGVIPRLYVKNLQIESSSEDLFLPVTDSKSVQQGIVITGKLNLEGSEISFVRSKIKDDIFGRQVRIQGDNLAKTQLTSKKNPKGYKVIIPRSNARPGKYRIRAVLLEKDLPPGIFIEGDKKALTSNFITININQLYLFTTYLFNGEEKQKRLNLSIEGPSNNLSQYKVKWTTSQGITTGKLRKEGGTWVSYLDVDMKDKFEKVELISPENTVVAMLNDLIAAANNQIKQDISIDVFAPSYFVQEQNSPIVAMIYGLSPQFARRCFCRWEAPNPMDYYMSPPPGVKGIREAPSLLLTPVIPLGNGIYKCGMNLRPKENMELVGDICDITLEVVVK